MGRLIPWQNFHITLLFLGEIDGDTSDQIIDRCARVSNASFDLDLTRVGFWPRQQLLWLAPDKSPPALRQLATQLQAVQQSLGLAVEKRCYFPHVTLARRVQHVAVPEKIHPVHWQCREYYLLRSVTAPEGVHYRVVETWPLNG